MLADHEVEAFGTRDKIIRKVENPSGSSV
jgi:hypothetical protein